MLDVKDREIQQLKEQQEAILDMMQLAFCAVSLWAQATGLEKSDSPEEDVREELADRKEKIRALFGEPRRSGPVFLYRPAGQSAESPSKAASSSWSKA